MRLDVGGAVIATVVGRAVMGLDVGGAVIATVVGRAVLELGEGAALGAQSKSFGGFGQPLGNWSSFLFDPSELHQGKQHGLKSKAGSQLAAS